MKWYLKSNQPLGACLLLLGAFAALACAQGTPQAPRAEDYAPYPVPEPGYVTDLALLLSPEQKQELNTLLQQVESRTGVEIAVVTIFSIGEYPKTFKHTIESFAKGLFDKWGIGNLPANNGVLLLVAVKDRKARVELGAAYGRTRDKDASRIMDTVIVPRFKKADYAGGITLGVRAIVREFSGMSLGLSWREIPPHLLALVVALPILVVVAVSLFRNGKRGWGWVVVGLIIVIAVVLLRSVIGAIARRSSRDDDGGSWGSGGGGSDGGGGFGGGSSGGGGATGSW
jgi:uncharacterized protein